MKGLILGASSGIGKATHEELMREHARIDWLTPDKEDLDVRDNLQLRRYVKANGPFDYIVFSVGVNYIEWIGQMDVTPTFDVMDVNLTSFINLLNQLMHRFPSHPARVVVIGSDAAERPLRTSIAYCASKAGLHMAVRVAARELGPKGWRLNVVAPGMTDNTGMQEYVDEKVAVVRGWDAEFMRTYEKQQEVVPGRLAPQEVADVVVSTLFGPDHLNGSIITINGGR